MTVRHPGRLVPVDSLDDPRLRGFRSNDRGLASRADRRDDAGAGLFIAEGDLVVARALDAGCEPVAALADGDRSHEVVERLLHMIDVHVGGEEIRRSVTGLGVAQPVVALFRRPPRQEAATLAATAIRLVVLEGVDNPSNVGSVIRNAAALGWDGLLLDHTSADPLSRRALRVAMGTAFSLAHARTPDLAAALATMTAVAPGAEPATIVALTPADDAEDLAAVAAHLAPTGRCAVLIGAERAGLSPALLGVATHRARIPMAGGVDSLNAAAATAIACYALRR